MSPEPYLRDEEGALLLRIARDSMERYVHEGAVPDLDAYPLTPPLHEKHGAFVSLYQAQQLRGCMGYTKSLEPLAQAVRDCAINAAARDPRFAPVRPEELSAITIEVTALCPGAATDSPFIPVHDLSEVTLGTDGLYLEHAGPRGGSLLLPQAAVEHGWDVQAFLEALCHQADVPADGWKDPGAVLYRFTAQRFAEPGQV